MNNPRAPKQEVKVEMGSHQAVVIDKLFGPAVARDLRVWYDDGEWVVERDSSGEDNHYQPRWVEVARFDADPE